MSKKPTKTIIAKVPKTKSFDISFTKEKENERIIVALDSLKQNSGWKFLEQILEENKKALAKQIIEKVDDKGNILSDQDVDKLRDKHGYLKELLEKPDYFLKMLKPTSEEDEDEKNLDPYT